MGLNYFKGDATDPVSTDPTVYGGRIIVHCCNNIGAWGKGFVLAVSKRWPHVEKAYRELGSWELGDVQFVQAESGIIVANLIGQNGIATGGYRQGPPPIRYEAIEQGLKVVRYKALNPYQLPMTVHMPRMGTGLAGGRWEEIESIIKRTLNGVMVCVYDLE